MNEIKDIFADVNAKKSKKLKSDVKCLVDLLNDHRFKSDFSVQNLPHEDISYYAGYIVRSFSRRKSSCTDCMNLIKSEADPEKKDDYISSISRGGLIHPSDVLLMTSLHACALWVKIRDTDQLRNMLLQSTNAKDVFAGCFLKLVKSDIDAEYIVTAKCKKDHSFKDLIPKIAAVIFNGCAKNYVTSINSKIHAAKKRKSTKKSPTARKALKLSSGGSAMKTVAVTTTTPTTTTGTPTTATTTTTNKSQEKVGKTSRTPDCGQCKYCLDKKKFGGQDRLKQRCITKSKKK